MTTFGASGPAPDLFAHFGFTPSTVADRARALLRDGGGDIDVEAGAGSGTGTGGER